MTHMLPPRFAHGQILLLALVFAGIFFTVSTALVGHVTSYGRAGRATVANAQALALAEGALDNTIGKLNQQSSYSGETDTPLGNGVFSVSIGTIDSKTKRVTATGYVPNRQDPVATQTIKATIGINDATVSFHYGIQSGNGGFSLENSSSVTGNVFSNGNVIGDGGNYIYGDVISSGQNGVVYGIHATGTVYAHTIGGTKSTIIDKDAYYATSLTNTTVQGSMFPGSPDQATTSLPISDEQIGEWEALAEAGGVAVCPDGVYSISSGEADIGPLKIPCDLTISGTAVVTMHGHVWVTGNITVQNSATVRMAAELGAENVALIADDPSDRQNGSRIQVRNTATFEDSGTPGSFVFLISQNNSAENGGDVEAFTLTNSASALVAYAAHGLIPLQNQISLKEVTAYKIVLKNSANVVYDSGLPNSVFKSGTGGSWGFIPGTYSITR